MNKQDLRIIFMGTPEFAVASLRALVEGGYNVVAVVTQPDRPVGRHASVVQPSDVKRYALQNGIPVLQPERMKDDEFLKRLRAFQADLQVVVAFRMLPEVVWDMPRFGTFNVHAALLPQYRGAAPINWAVINGETTTGVTTFFLDRDIDTGRVIMQRPFDIPDQVDVEYVYDGLMRLGAEVCLDTVDAIIHGNGDVPSMPQEQMMQTGTVLHDAPKLFKENCRIDWTLSTKRVYDFVRGLSPYPGAWTMLRHGDEPPQMLKVYATAKCPALPGKAPVGAVVVRQQGIYVATVDGAIRLKALQMAGKRRMTDRDFINGFRDDGAWCVQ